MLPKHESFFSYRMHWQLSFLVSFHTCHTIKYAIGPLVVGALYLRWCWVTLGDSHCLSAWLTRGAAGKEGFEETHAQGFAQASVCIALDTAALLPETQ